MVRHLNLLKNDREQEEKRTFPRFRIPSITFKDQNSKKIFEVDDVSPSGMKIQLKVGTHDFDKKDSVRGMIRWQGRELLIDAKVAWVAKTRAQAGVTFEKPQEIEDFFSMKNIIQGAKILHHPPFDEEKPPRLKYWLKSASVFEVLVWAHGDGVYEKIQILFTDHFIEWKDGEGARTGLLLQRRDKDTPLSEQDEWTIRMDGPVDRGKMKTVCRLLENIPENKMEEFTKKFILGKLKAA
ncbi:MAG: PilZ domain-containing protein [Bacteriovoracales bacterium]|nr:PilZ domain-containing protein [Bacteriovoracales bacterium]